MAEILKDGTGSGYQMRIDGNNRAHVQAVTIPENEFATENEDSYNLNTGVITLTSDSETPVMYVKNNDTRDLHIRAIAVGLGPTTGGSGGIPVIKMIRNPKDGTITSGSDIAVSSNRNFGSAKALVADQKVGATGLTMTGGTDHLILFQGAGDRLLASIDEVIPVGSTVGITVTPQSGNTSMDVYAALICDLSDPAGAL